MIARPCCPSAALAVGSTTRYDNPVARYPSRLLSIVRILQGIAQGVPTRHLAQELGLDRKHLLERRHQIQTLAEQACPREALVDAVVEADEMDQNAGEKGRLHPDPEDPPRRRANPHGTWDTDRPPILGIVGRDSGQIQLSLKNSFANALTPSANAITCNKVMRPVIPL